VYGTKKRNEVFGMARKKPNYAYGYGMFVLSIFSFIAGASTIRSQGFTPVAAGTLFMGLFLGVQYLKEMGRTPPKVIKVLTWISVIGFFIVDMILVYDWIK